MTQIFNYGSGRLTSGIAIAIARGSIKGVLSVKTVEQIRQSQQHVQDIISMKRTVYGVNTGFGILANTGISAVVDPVRRITGRLDLGVENVLDTRLPAARALTPYARFGDAPAAALTFALFLVALLRRYRRLQPQGA